MLRSLSALAIGLVPQGVAAQALACSFTLICAPQIGCEAHDGVALDLAPTADGFALERDGAAIEGRLLDGADTLGVLFEDANGGRLMLSLSSEGNAALTEHRRVRGGAIDSSTFHGTCEVI